jgi:hypothetical protein
MFCTPKNEESGVRLNYELKEFNKQLCVGELCSSVKLQYPLFSGDSEEILFLNSHVEEQLIMMTGTFENPNSNSLEGAVDNFLNSYQKFMGEFESIQEWTVVVESKIGLLTPNLISMQFDSYSFTGGAHPNSFRVYINFDRVLQRPLRNEELILDKKRLLQLAESKFRTHHDVKDSVSLEEDGRFFLENDRDFFLPVAMGFEGGDFVLYYNTYEIGPYVFGPSELIFTKEEVEGVIEVKE